MKSCFPVSDVDDFFHGPPHVVQWGELNMFQWSFRSQRIKLNDKTLPRAFSLVHLHEFAQTTVNARGVVLHYLTRLQRPVRLLDF